MVETWWIKIIIKWMSLLYRVSVPLESVKIVFFSLLITGNYRGKCGDCSLILSPKRDGRISFWSSSQSICMKWLNNELQIAPLKKYLNLVPISSKASLKALTLHRTQLGPATPIHNSSLKFGMAAAHICTSKMEMISMRERKNSCLQAL